MFQLSSSPFTPYSYKVCFIQRGPDRRRFDFSHCRICFGKSYNFGPILLTILCLCTSFRVRLGWSVLPGQHSHDELVFKSHLRVLPVTSWVTVTSLV